MSSVPVANRMQTCRNKLGLQYNYSGLLTKAEPELKALAFSGKLSS